eukprot:PhF_6_TR6076/c0_g1_i2/m.8852
MASPTPVRSPSVALKLLNTMQRPMQPNLAANSPCAKDEIASILRRSNSSANIGAAHHQMIMVCSNTNLDEQVDGSLNGAPTSPLIPSWGGGSGVQSNPYMTSCRSMASPPPRGSNPIVNDTAFSAISRENSNTVCGGGLLSSASSQQFIPDFQVPRSATKGSGLWTSGFQLSSDKNSSGAYDESHLFEEGAATGKQQPQTTDQQHVDMSLLRLSPMCM